MIKKMAFIAFGLALTMLTGQKVDFDTYFENGSLRIDFLLHGSYQKQSISIARMKREPLFGGGTSNQLLYPDYGNYRFQVRDKKSGELIFSKGFSPIFQEWQAMEEAKRINKTFENTMLIPFPKGEIIVDIQYRDIYGNFQSTFQREIDPKHYSVTQEKITPYPVTKIYDNGSPKQKLDLAIIAEGYTEAEMPKFISDAKRLVDYMFTIPPFNKYKAQFNVYAVQSPSLESGTDIPGEGVYKNTILNSNFYTFGEARYLTSMDNFKLADIAANVPYDQLYVLVNTPRYGGGGFYNVINLVSVDNELSDKVFVHEFGHGLVGLADEYYNASIGGSEYYNLNIEPWEKNITTLIDFDKKWKKKVKKGTPIPTPRTKKYTKTIGAFEGGGYVATGVYSPMQDCRMKSNEPEGFCPVCSDAINEIIEFYTK